MKQITQNYKTGELKIEDVPLPLIRKGGVLVRNHFSLISTGTERATLQVSRKGYIGKAKEKPEQVKQIIQIAKKQGLKKTYELVMNKLNTPVPLGYSSAGTVVEVGEEAYEFQVGDRVACGGAGYANHAEVIFVPKNLCAKIPESVELDEAAYTTVGSISLQGIRLADVRLGERVAVIGLGLVGLLTVQLLKAAGCTVVALDIDPNAIDNAKHFGADYVMNVESNDISSLIQSITQSVGMDATIITAATRSNKPVELAGKISRKKGRVVVVGDVSMNIPRDIYYAKEIDFKISCSYGPGRYDPNYEELGRDYPIAYVRWTEKRNMESFLSLLKERRIEVKKLTTHKFKLENAEEAYHLITSDKRERYIGILLEYDYQKEIEPFIRIKDIEPQKESKISIGMIGAGNFAQSTILPVLKKCKNINLEGIVEARSQLSQNIAEKYGFNKCYSDVESVFTDENINTVIIVTRHNLHAQYVIKGLKANKNVYVEKPLAINESEIKKIIHTRNELGKDVFVGFNRRFSSFIKKCKDFFINRSAPMFVNYRINAGYIPPEHWIQSEEEGGGRIIGEVCHFVDLCQFLCQANYKSIFAQNIGGDKNRDNIAVIIKFDDGSLANINYLSNGDIYYPKERIEIFCQNSIAVVDDFKKAEFIRGGKRRVYKKIQEKGHQKQIETWLNTLIVGESIPIPFIESLNSTIATLMIHESLNRGENLSFDEFSKRFIV